MAVAASQLAIRMADPDATPMSGSIAGLLRQRASETPDGTALIWKDEGSLHRLSFAELLVEAENAARAMLEHASPGDRVAVWARNSVQWVIAEYGCALGGFILTPWNTAWTDTEVAHAIELTEPTIILAEADTRGVDLLDRARSLGVGRVVEPLLEVGRKRCDPSVALPEVTAGTPYLIQFTSGTTGRAKGALHDQGSALNGGYLRTEMSGVEPGEVQLNVVPLHHVAGSVSLVIGALVAGAAYALMPRFDAVAYLSMIGEAGATRIGGVPTMLIGLLEHPDFPSRGYRLRGVGAGGTEVPEVLVRRLSAAFGCEVMVGYGQSECPLISNSLPGDAPDLIATTVGMPAPQNDIKIADPTTGRTLDIGKAGEICVRSPAMMRGYWDMPEATAEAIDAEGWLHTGDLGEMLPSGHIRFRGRVRDVIIRGGENIYPMEVEAALCMHPAVASASVVGIPDEKWGQRVGAVVQLAEQAQANVAELEEHLRGCLAHFKIPAKWTFVAQFPMTASGKIRKVELVKLFDATAPDRET